jgi:Tol biopolymer transport system component
VATGSPPHDVVRAQLARILASEVFARSDRLTAFLTYIVEQSLAGHGATLKEQVLAMEVYGKGADFGASVDPIVRVDARRLRDKLREYYASAPRDPVVISVPKGGYAAVFAVQSLAAAAQAGGDVARVESGPRSWRRLGIAWVVVVLIGTIAWLAIRNGMRSALPVRLLTVTSFPGSEGSPSFSPDGNFLAITWTGPDFAADGDLWVKAVGGDALRRLTDTPGVNEVMPAWSPDGQQIVFVRYAGQGNRGVYLMSALGGSDRKISNSGSNPAWLKDSHSVVFEDRVGESVALVHYILATGERRPLTTPPAGFSDFRASVSPDGKTLAFLRSTTLISQPSAGIRAGLFVMPITGGEPVRVDDRAAFGGPEWTPDSREILYPRWDAGGVKIFRVSASGGSPTPAAGLPITPYRVSISGFRAGGTFRVAMVDAQSDIGLRMIDLQAPQPGGRMSGWTAFCDSTHIEWPGRFSRDGTKVSFTSDRGGLAQIFAASRDGTQVRTLTAFEGSGVGLASWSPDGQSLVFDGVDGQGRADLYIVSADGGSPRRLTNDNRRENNPEWSRDGRWIYYAAAVSGRSEIWKIPAAGGTPVQITMQGGIDPRESPDGRSVYFLEAPPGPYSNPFWAPKTLQVVSVDGGKASKVLSGIRQGRWDLADTGVVFLTGPAGLTPDPAAPDAIEFFSFTDGRTRRLGELPFSVTSYGYSPLRAITASPDGRWVVVSHMDHWARDIVVADNFR